MEILITLCARGGSKGIPGKNIKPINGIPALVYSIRHAQAFAGKFNADITISTDDDAIRSVAASNGLSTAYVRPADLSNDQTGKIETIAGVLEYEERSRRKRYDFILDLDVSSPLRNIQDLTDAFESIAADQDALNLFSVNKANRNPYFNMVEVQDNGYYSQVKKGKFLTRQSAPEVFELNASFYFYRRAFFDAGNTSAISERSLIYVMPHICFDLDHPVDFDFMEYLIVNNKLGFNL